MVMGERKEIFMRIVVGIVSGIILTVWKWLIFVFVIINIIYTLFAGKRFKELAELSEIWNTQRYTFLRYILLVSNKRPFPFTRLEKSISRFEK